jgi:hypothetical protein
MTGGGRVSLCGRLNVATAILLLWAFFILLFTFASDISDFDISALIP